jgi:hypothetical protein
MWNEREDFCTENYYCEPARLRPHDLAKQLPSSQRFSLLLCSKRQLEILGNRRSDIFLHRQKRFPMNSRSLRIPTFLAALLTAHFAASSALAQTETPQTKPKLSLLLREPKSADSNSTPLVRSPVPRPIRPAHIVLSRHVEKEFILLSAGVYTAAILDMHQTLAVRSSPWWYETDPLAKPFVRLPAPAYYVTGLALATGVNWLSWKMGHSRRWRKLAPIPQIISIGGNLYGFHTNRFQSQ